MADKPKQRTVMFFSAHPADPFDSAGGTIALHAEAGDRVIILSMTPGARSHAPKVYDNYEQGQLTAEKEAELYAETVAAKKAEFKNACDAVGAEMVCLDFVDEPFIATREAILAVGECYRKYRPDILVTHHKTEMNNHDHPAAGEVSLRAVTSAGRWLEGSKYAPHNISQVYFYGIQFRRLPLVVNATIPLPSTHVVNVESVVDKKIASLAAFVSQAFSGMDYSSKEYADTRINAIEGWFGLENGMKYAEIFIAMKPQIVDTLE